MVPKRKTMSISQRANASSRLCVPLSKISVAKTNHMAKICVKIVGAIEFCAKENKYREGEELGLLMQSIDHNEE